MSGHAAFPGASPGPTAGEGGNEPRPRLHRREVVARLLAARGDLLVVTGLGAPTWDATAAGDHPLTFPLWGAMGHAVMTGLGLALARPERRVLVITGDGEALMGMGALATVGVQRPRNLAVAILDNGRYGETGMQPSHTALGVDLAGVARACGFAFAAAIDEESEVETFRRRAHELEGPSLGVVKVLPEKLPLVLPPRDGSFLKRRFREALTGVGGEQE